MCRSGYVHSWRHLLGFFECFEICSWYKPSAIIGGKTQPISGRLGSKEKKVAFLRSFGHISDRLKSLSILRTVDSNPVNPSGLESHTPNLNLGKGRTRIDRRVQEKVVKFGKPHLPFRLFSHAVFCLFLRTSILFSSVCLLLCPIGFRQPSSAFVPHRVGLFIIILFPISFISSSVLTFLLRDWKSVY